MIELRTPERTRRTAAIQHGADFTEEALPFTVRVARTAADLEKVVRIRQSAYGRHLPELAETLGAPEEMDLRPGVIVLLAESKLDGSPIGTIRIQTNAHGPLAVEQSVELPDGMANSNLAEMTRLAISEGRVGRLVKLVLLKACYEFWKREGIDYAIGAGRAPLDRQYEQLLFTNVFEDGRYVPLRHAGNVPHRVLAFHVDSGEARWAAAGHPMFKFFCRTWHPDIDLGPRLGKTLRPRLHLAGLRPGRIARVQPTT
ncbi:hypothetical protein E4K72_21465 [Oxalobacteraceae bacterium OM1]|nr:hypothetical protein E4K72_21465 [Oxalobacteraceae bacterium OM1]